MSESTIGGMKVEYYEGPHPPPMPPPEPRPPLGLEPRKIWVEARTRAVLEAMLRYVNAGYAVPQAWRDELGLNLADLEDEASP